MGSEETFFVDFIEEENVSDELKNFYKLIYDEPSNLNSLINENKDRYSSINLNDLEDLPEEFYNIVKEIKKIYGFILPQNLDVKNLEQVNENKKILDILINHINKLKEMIKEELDELFKKNRERQEKIKKINYSDVDKKTLVEILNKYNNLLYCMYSKDDNIFIEYKKQMKIKNEINKIYRLINLEIDYEKNNTDKLENLKEKTTQELKKLYDKIIYLEDLMIEGSKHLKEFSDFKKLFLKLTAYDDNNYMEISKVYNFIKDNNILLNKFNELELLLINEREYKNKEQNFIFEKIGLKNIKISLDYISANYIDKLNYSSKQIINELYNDITKEECNVYEAYKKLKRVVNYIWRTNTTDIFAYEQGKDFCFICTNNQFIDEKYQAILITKKMLERVENYSDYQIGFVCNFNDNILYVTEEEDIMLVEANDMSNLKTPKQIEQEFLNFKIRNRIALNGYVTSISAVYFINDGDYIKYRKAVELANQYKLPLLMLKKR